MNVDDLTDFYSGYFSDQNIGEGSREIAAVFSQTRGMRDRLSEFLGSTEQMILARDPAVLAVFEDTCLFEPTGDPDRDWSRLGAVFAGIRDSVAADPLWARSHADHAVGDVAGDYVSVVVAAFRSLLNSHGAGAEFSAEQLTTAAHDFGVLERAWFTDRMEAMLIKDLNHLVAHHWEALTGRNGREELDSTIRGILR